MTDDKMALETRAREFVSAQIAGCGCVEENWVVAGLDVAIHFEDGHAGCFVDAGDWDVENKHIGPPDIAREAAFAFIESWPHEDEMEGRANG